MERGIDIFNAVYEMRVGLSHTKKGARPKPPEIRDRLSLKKGGELKKLRQFRIHNFTPCVYKNTG